MVDRDSTARALAVGHALHEHLQATLAPHPSTDALLARLRRRLLALAWILLTAACGPKDSGPAEPAIEDPPFVYPEEPGCRRVLILEDGRVLPIRLAIRREER